MWGFLAFLVFVGVLEFLMFLFHSFVGFHEFVGVLAFLTFLFHSFVGFLVFLAFVGVLMCGSSRVCWGSRASCVCGVLVFLVFLLFLFVSGVH